jgi:uncharacterized zinc-type alcohol dehydrogenase-like protein
MVDSCLSCAPCSQGQEQFCANGMTGTYNSRDRQDGSTTQGGYSNQIVVREEFVLSLPDALDEKRAAPLLCAGITTFSPLRKYRVGPGSMVGVAGLGGLGHMGVKLAKALGAHVTMITTSPEKGEDARELGADAVLLSTDKDAMKKHGGAFDLVLDTIPVSHDLKPYLDLLKPNGNLVMVGAIEPLPSIHGAQLVMKNLSVAGSLIGGIPETQEVLDFCAEHDIHPEVEMIRMDEVNHAWERMERGDVRYRFVIDMSTLSNA